MKLLKLELIPGAGCCFWSHSCCFMRREARGRRLQCYCLCLTCSSNTRPLKLNQSSKVWPFHCPWIHITLKTGNGTRSPNFKKSHKEPFKCLWVRKHCGLGEKLLHREGHSQEQPLLILKSWRPHEAWLKASLVVSQNWRKSNKTNIHYTQHGLQFPVLLFVCFFPLPPCLSQASGPLKTSHIT